MTALEITLLTISAALLGLCYWCLYNWRITIDLCKELVETRDSLIYELDHGSHAFSPVCPNCTGCPANA